MILALAAVGLVLSVTFVLMMLSVNWWATYAGKSTMVFSIVLAVVMGMVTARYAGLEMPKRFLEIIYFLIDGALLYKIISFVRSRRAGLREQHPEEGAHL